MSDRFGADCIVGEKGVYIVISGISAPGFSSADISSLERNISCFPQYVVMEILGRLTLPGSDREIIPSIFRSAGRIYGAINASLSGGPESWSEVITAGGSNENEVWTSLARALCAPLIPGVARRDYEAGAAYIKVRPEKPGDPANYYRLTPEREIHAYSENGTTREVVLTSEAVGKMSDAERRSCTEAIAQANYEWRRELQEKHPLLKAAAGDKDQDWSFAESVMRDAQRTGVATRVPDNFSVPYSSGLAAVPDRAKRVAPIPAWAKRPAA